MRTASFTAILALSVTTFAYSAATQPASQGLIGKPWGPSATDKVVNISGIYPHLAVYSGYGEVGIGAIVPWADKLWYITYPPHYPAGSQDKLYTVDKDLRMEVRPESVGGTHANRMIHQESKQLIIGPYFIDEKGNVRAADPKVLRARLTSTVRHLTDPANKVYFVGMEKELYEVDVHTLATKCIYAEAKGLFPGTHGKGAVVAQGRIIVANNGERGWSLGKDAHFDGPAGCLAESDGKDWSQPWKVIERTNFCEVTSPDGINGAAPDARVWATGWDKRSIILKLLENGEWHTYRLPKGSYTHDAMHGWYTEWPRIREVTDGKLLMHMHGLFYDFPRTFSAANIGGLKPISNYLRMPVDYCAWQGQIVMSRDDASVMQNALAGQSNSNIWFGKWADLERFGAPAGWGGPWVDDAVKADQPSVPFLVNGFSRATLHLAHAADAPVRFTIEADADGKGNWQKVTTIEVPAKGYKAAVFTKELAGGWWRIKADRDAAGVTAYFHLSNPPHKPQTDIFKGLADVSAKAAICDGVMKGAAGDARTLLFANNSIDDAGALKSSSFYEMDGRLQLAPSADPERGKTLREKYGVDKPDFAVDAASVIVTEGGARYRLPKTNAAYDAAFAGGWPRGKREVVTERNILNAHGTLYDVPRSDTGGYRRMRAITTHGRHIGDFCSWRGMLVLAGVSAGAEADGHVFRSADNQAALWFGDVNDLWRFGAPVGSGGPWNKTAVKANAPSDPYLMAGFDRKTLTISHDAAKPVTVSVLVNFLADGQFHEYTRLAVEPGKPLKHEFPAGFSAHWARLSSDADATITAQFDYTAAED